MHSLLFLVQLLLVSLQLLQIRAHGTIAQCADVRVKCPAGRHCEDTPTGITCAPDPVCPPNEVFNICASDCEQNCVPLGRPCTTACLPPRCQCQEGFVRQGYACIRPEECPQRQGITTSTKSYVDEPFTPTSSGCVLCISGYHCEVTGGAPRCVADHSQLPQPPACERLNCPANQHCEYYEDGVVKCAPNPGCGQNEVFRTCATCEPTCGLAVPCVPLCLTPACQCIAGYVRDQGRCIEASTCERLKK